MACSRGRWGHPWRFRPAGAAPQLGTRFLQLGFGADLQWKRGARGQASSSPRVIGQKKQFYDTSTPILWFICWESSLELTYSSSGHILLQVRKLVVNSPNSLVRCWFKNIFGNWSIFKGIISNTEDSGSETRAWTMRAKHEDLTLNIGICNRKLLGNK